MKKLIVNEKCIGCGACVAIDSEHFDFNENSLSEVISEDNLESETLKSAMESCPVGAIEFITENEENTLKTDNINTAKDENEENTLETDDVNTAKDEEN